MTKIADFNWYLIRFIKNIWYYWQSPVNYAYLFVLKRVKNFISSQNLNWALNFGVMRILIALGCWVLVSFFTEKFRFGWDMRIILLGILFFVPGARTFFSAIYLIVLLDLFEVLKISDAGIVEITIGIILTQALAIGKLVLFYNNFREKITVVPKILDDFTACYKIFYLADSLLFLCSLFSLIILLPLTLLLTIILLPILGVGKLLERLAKNSLVGG